MDATGDLATPPRPARRLSSAWSVAVGAVAFALMSRLPLFFTDLWAHVAYGRWTVANGIPQTEPLMPLCRGVPMPPVDWLWNVIAYAMQTLPGGAANLVLLQAVPVAVAAFTLTLRWQRLTRSVPAALAGVAAVGWLWWEQLIIRPQLVGMAFLAVAWLVAGGPIRRRRWSSAIAIAATFALWANLHGSWPVGLLLLGVEWLRRPPCRRELAALIAVAAGAVCLNPHGPRLYRDVLSLAANTGIGDLIEWRPLVETPRQRRAVVAVTTAAAAALSASRCRSWWRVALGVALLGLTIRTSRWIVWYAPVAGELLAVSLASMRSRSVRRGLLGPFLAMPHRRIAWATVAVAMVAAVATLPRSARTTGVPVEAIRHLRTLAAERDATAPDLIFNRQGFGDAILWFGPRSMKPFVHSHVHLVPSPVWRDYRRAITQPDAAGSVLDAYGCRIAVLQRHRDGELYDALRAGGWRLSHADRLAVVLVRDRVPLTAAERKEPKIPAPVGKAD